jgi:nitrogen fixation/metabolism regulation signal transduction histidine kinase
MAKGSGKKQRKLKALQASQKSLEVRNAPKLAIGMISIVNYSSAHSFLRESAKQNQSNDEESEQSKGYALFIQSCAYVIENLLKNAERTQEKEHNYRVNYKDHSNQRSVYMITYLKISLVFLYYFQSFYLFVFVNKFSFNIRFAIKSKSS